MRPIRAVGDTKDHIMLPNQGEHFLADGHIHDIDIPVVRLVVLSKRPVPCHREQRHQPERSDPQPVKRNQPHWHPDRDGVLVGASFAQ